MKAFATIEDLEARWKTLSEDERKKARVLLDDASAFVSTELARYHIEPSDELTARACLAVVCSMVKRSMVQQEEANNSVTQYTQSAGEYSESFTYANPTGDMYLTKAERNLLGLGRQKLFSIYPHIGGIQTHDPWRDYNGDPSGHFIG